MLMIENAYIYGLELISIIKMNLKSKQIDIETTNICSAKCPICPRDEFTQKLGVMEYGLFKKIIDDIASYEVEYITLTGFGDPLADKHLFKRCQYIREKLPKVKIYISTTCALMTPDKYDDIIKYIDILKISIFGITKESYEKSHAGSLKFEKSYSNILGFIDKIGQIENRPYLEALLVLTDINNNEMDEWIQYWEPKLDEVFVWKPHNFGDKKDYRVIDKKNMISCGRPENGQLYVHVDGKSSMCCFDINKQLTVGDMNNQSIYDIFHSKEFKHLKKFHKNNDYEGTYCENCDQINYNPDVLIYSTDKTRKVGQKTLSKKPLLLPEQFKEKIELYN